MSKALVATATAIAAVVVSILMLAPGAQAAAPGWQVLAAAAPTNLPPSQSEIQQVAVDATGGSFRLTLTTAKGSGTLSVASGFGNTTSGSNEVTGVFALGGSFAVGQTIAGPGIPTGTTITAVGSGTLTLSASATATGSFVSLNAGSTEVTGVTTSSGVFRVGDAISGTGIPTGTTVTAVGSGTLTLSEAATAGGASTLTASETTAAIPYDAAASGAGSVEEALAALPAIGSGTVSVTGGPGDAGATHPYNVEFGGSLAHTDVAQMTADSTLLTGGGHTATVSTSLVGGPGTGAIAIYATNVGGAATSGTVTLDVSLPTGITTGSTPGGVDDFGTVLPPGPPSSGWNCAPTGSGQSTVSCMTTVPTLPGRNAQPIQVPVRVGAEASGIETVQVSISGGGAADPASYDEPITISQTPAPAGLQAFWAGAYDEDGKPDTRAGGHPYQAMTGFLLNTIRGVDGKPVPAGDLKDVRVDLPPGFVGNPQAAAKCPHPSSTVNCDNEAIVGIATPVWSIFNSQLTVGPVYNTPSDPGAAAQLAFVTLTAPSVLVGDVRSDDDFGVTVIAKNTVQIYKVYGSFVSIWGVPGDPSHDIDRCQIRVGISGGHCETPSSSTNQKAFLTNPTDCEAEAASPPVTWMSVSHYQSPSVFSSGSYGSPPVVGCEDVPFDPAMSVSPTSTAPDSASGLDVDISLPQDGLTDREQITTGSLKKTVVQLPEGMSVNPSGATGLAGCTDEQIGLRSKAAPTCPDGSKIGAVEVTSPLLDQPLSGDLYLGTPKSTDPQSGQMLRLFLAVANARYGVRIKLAGSAVADPATGRLTATFDENPRLPFDRLSVKLKGGDRGVLAMPQRCGPIGSVASMTPWSRSTAVELTTPSEVRGDCSFGFAPALAAGMDNPAARGTGTFSFKFSREDGQQWVDRLTTELPAGLLASVKDVPLCSAGQAAAGACPAASRIGSVDATAGSGRPFVLERKGAAYLTEGYKGCAYGLLVNVPVVAGPFRGDMQLGDINVRQSACVDPVTARITATSDPLPKIHHGVPLRIRSVTVLVDRPSFMVNPSDCSPTQTGAAFSGAGGAGALASAPFQASGCAALPFKPKLELALTGRRQTRTGKHPGINAQVTQRGVSEAGIERAVVRLPKSLALDPNNAQALCEFTDGTKPDLEKRCPKGSIVGRARAKTPLLEDDLVGNVYFVKNVRIDPRTGNRIRTLPMIVVALRGEIAINLKGESSTTKGGKLVNTFASVPDAPISRFNLNVKGGKNGIIAVTRTRKAKINLCAGRHVAEADIDGQNGRRHDFDVRMKTPCTRKQTRKAKRAAAKARR